VGQFHGVIILAARGGAGYDPLTMIGRDVLFEEEASANYRLREVKHRRSGEVRWEVLDATSGLTVVGGLADRQEALRVVRGWERLSLRLEGGLAGHRLLN
jgi:hypothetical protein